MLIYKHLFYFASKSDIDKSLYSMSEKCKWLMIFILLFSMLVQLIKFVQPLNRYITSFTLSGITGVFIKFVQPSNVPAIF